MKVKTTRERPFPQPISILKPVKGVDGDLRVNFESFFNLKYMKFEILFSVADAGDPAVPVIQELIAKYPRVRARLIIGDVKIGANPKVSNLVSSYAQAQHDWILISDSNVCVDPDYLYTAIEHFTSDVGVVTAVVSGRRPAELGGWLEAVFLNTFYARWMLLSRELGNPVVVGKSMLFRKSDLERFGGLKVLSGYLAEDYMAGIAMLHLKRRVEIMAQPIVQPLSQYSFAAFWSRHVRWGRIRKSQAPQLFAVEPVFSLWLTGIFGALGFCSLFNFGLGGASAFVGVHILVWMICDLLMMRATDSGLGIKGAFFWFLRESLYLPMWFHIALSSRVLWRGRKLRLLRGGIVETVDSSI